VSPRPLLVTDDDAVLDHLLGLVHAAGLEPSVARDAASAAGAWTTAPVVVLDVGLAEAGLAVGLPRRPGLVVVVPDGDARPDVWPLALRLGAEEVACLPDSDAWLRQRVAEAAVGTGRARVVAVTGACGGAGSSTLAVALAVTAVADGLDAVLVDADPWGGGLDLLLGAEGTPGVRWHDLAQTSGRVARGSVVPALPRSDDLPVLAWGRGTPQSVPTEAFDHVVDGVSGGGDLVVVDLGRGSVFTRSAVGRSDTVLLVATARLRAVAAAAQLLAVTGEQHDVRLLVRSEGRHGLDPTDLAEALGLPLAGIVPRDTRRAEDEEFGVAPALARRSGLARLCGSLLRDLDLGRAA
jgi:secretion/DNA translocation related CpaE-like protein